MVYAIPPAVDALGSEMVMSVWMPRSRTSAWWSFSWSPPPRVLARTLKRRPSRHTAPAAVALGRGQLSLLEGLDVSPGSGLLLV